MVTTIYWLLLTYILAALVWWFISLEEQNKDMAHLRYLVISRQASESPGSDLDQLSRQLKQVDNETKRNSTKYISEGITFFILILIGAAFVYRSVRKQLKFQQQQQNFMMAVTHELKTPISVVRLNLETLLKYQLEPEKQKKIIQTTLSETFRLNTLTNNILVSSEIEGEGYVFAKEELDLSDLFKDCIHEYRNRYPERNFIEEIEPEIELEGDALLLQLMINNLLENAVKYSPKTEPIIGRLEKIKDSVILCIIDQGQGIPEAEKENIFEKFYRIGNEETRTTQGTGLGLYLCRKIAEDHHAEISVVNNIPRGSIFTINFHVR